MRPESIGVDRVLLAEHLHLRLGEARVREHAALARHEAEVARPARARAGARPARRASADAVAHHRELGLPERAELRDVEHGARRSRRRASAGWSSWCARCASAATAPARPRPVGRDDAERADALAVERERLRERARHEDRSGVAAKRRTTAPSASMPSAKPWYAMSRNGASPRAITTSMMRPHCSASDRRRSGCGSTRAARRSRPAGCARARRSSRRSRGRASPGRSRGRC